MIMNKTKQENIEARAQKRESDTIYNANNNIGK
jgi:hypothetical protein